MTNRAVVVNCFDTYERRARLVYNFFKSKGYDTMMLTSSFSHIYKKEIGIAERYSDYVYLPAYPYHKNLSFQRMYSHFKLSKIIYKYLEEIKPDVLYVLCPPNSFAKVGGQYKMRHKHSFLIIDMIDLWPETLPVKCSKNIFPLSIWRDIRNDWLHIADYVLVECALYKSFLQQYNSNIHTLYFAKEDTGIVVTPMLDNEKICLCYLGSINNLIDIDAIVNLISALKVYSYVTLHIIGDGRTREKFIQKAKNAGADIIYHGKLFDEQEKHKIFSTCHYGLNIMKDSVCVGLTMKSIDYLEASLPIINTIKGDTWTWVENYHLGINYKIQEYNLVAKKIYQTLENNQIMRRQCRDIFLRNLSSEAFINELELIFNKRI